MIPFVLALTLSILLTLVFAIPGVFMCIRWLGMYVTEHTDMGVGDKIPTFYAIELEPESDSEKFRYIAPRLFCMPIVGLVFGGIHCVGWFFDFPSNDEAMLWRVSSAVLTGIAFLLPIIFLTSAVLMETKIGSVVVLGGVAVFAIMLVAYVVSRLLLLVEAFISLRHLTPGMLALVKWTSFIQVGRASCRERVCR